MSTTRFWDRREDTSCTTRVRFDDRGCTVFGPELRASVHERRREPGSADWRVCTAPGPGNVDAVTPEPSWKSRVAEWQSVCAMARGLDCQLTTTRMHRSYRNSEGVAFARCWTWTDMEVTCQRSRVKVVDGLESPAEVARRLRSCIDELAVHRQAARRRQALEGPRDVHLLLPPTEAGVLFHELLCHGAEDGWDGMVAGARLGPGCMHVVVRHPWSAFCDDEGVRTGDIELVRDGLWTGALLRDRTSARGVETPSGLAIAGIHGELPRLRCVRMTLLGRGERVFDVIRDAGQVLRCTGVAGAEVDGGVAHVAAYGGDVWDDGRDTGARVGSFLFEVSLNELADKLVALPGEVTPTRARACVKARDSVPACTEAPHAVLAGVRVRPLP